jgi:mRNA interferase RelE/StbE
VSYRILIDSRAAKQLERLPKSIVGRIHEAVTALADQPRPPGAKLLRGKLKSGWRVRIGDYRVLYRIDDERKEVAIFDIGHRRELYR